MKFETGQTSSNKSQQHATTHNMVCKRSQHVGPNNVASCWPTMLRAFARAFMAYCTGKLGHTGGWQKKGAPLSEIKIDK